MTYSIIGRDPESGWMGAAVQSHYFGTGRVVTWAEAGVGAVATQSIPDVGYGPRGLDLMRSGVPAADALERLVAADPMAPVRQVAMIDASGNVAVHTGEGCIAAAGHAPGAQVSAQANLVTGPEVWRSMLRAFEGTAGQPLPDRLLAALEAAEAAGGDLRGRQSAAMLVVSGERTSAPWDHRIVDLRVDDHPDPLGELRRLLERGRAFDRLSSVFFGGLLFSSPAPDAPELLHALAELDATQEVLGQNREPTFWQAVLLAKAGRAEEAREKLRKACETNPRWAELIDRLVPAGIIPPDEALLARLRT
jgi:uncharacterized Ntn-hydrolase superfamily protein